MAQSGRTIRVYVSSTYRDIHAERDYLHKIVFPELRERMAALNLNLVVTDPLWGVAEDKDDIELAFKEIEQSTYFIGILGECYGVIPDTIPENTLVQYPWLKDYPGHSLPALEILHALHTPNFSNHCLFYFRDPKIVSEIPEARRSGYVAKDHEETLKVKELKDKIRASGCLTQENYPCQWDDQKRCFVELESFGQRVVDDLWTAIYSEYSKDSLSYKKELAIKEKALGTEHPDTIQSLNNLAELYRNKGDYACAEALYRRVLAIEEKVLGKEHPNMATSLDNLAGLLCCKGDYEGAKSLYRRALAIREKTLGTNHPAVVRYKNNLANWLERKNEANLPIKDSIDINTLNIQPKQPLYLDENVQFTVYRPKKIQPLKWYPLLAFAHLSECPPDAKEDEPDPMEEVQKQAKQILGEQVDNYADLTHDSRQAVPRQGEITLVPEVPGIEFNPPSRSFLWTETVHKEEFRIRASHQLDGKIAEGRISVFLSGSIILAEVYLRIKVDSREQIKSSAVPYEHTNSKVYRKIFASYSRRDELIVNEFEKYAKAIGDEYLRDLVHIRTGEVWDDRLKQMIHQADVFQLFWSWSSIRSKFVEREWRYALSLKRAKFVRPVYWEDPLPELKEENLPPEELQRLQFQRLPVKTASVEYSQRQGKTRTTEKSANQVRKKDTSAIRHKKYHVPEPQTLKKIKPTKRKVFRYPTIICLVMFFVAGFIIGIPIYKNYSDKRVQSSVDGKNTIASKEESKKLLQTQSVPQELQDETKNDIKNGEKKKISPINLAETDKQSNVKEDKNKVDTATKTEQKPMKVASKDFMNSDQWTIQNYSSSKWNLNVPGNIGSMNNLSSNTKMSSNDILKSMPNTTSKDIGNTKEFSACNKMNTFHPGGVSTDFKEIEKDKQCNLAETDKQSNVEEDKNKLDTATKVAFKDLFMGKFRTMSNLPRDTEKFSKIFSKSISNKDSVGTGCANMSSQLKIQPGGVSANLGNIKIEKEAKDNGTVGDECKAIESKANILKANGKFDEALKLFKEQELICRKQGDKDVLQSLLGNQALILIDLGELDKALELLREKEHICREFGNNKELVSSLLNQAVILSQRMNCLREALPLAEEAYKLAAKEGLIEQTQQIKRIINSIKNEK